MKRVITLAVMLLVAAFAVEAKAQSSQLVGKWKIKDISTLADDGFECTKYTITFDADGEGEADFETKGKVELDDQYTLYMTTELDVEFTWQVSDSRLSLSNIDIEIDFDDLSITPYSEEVNQLLPMLKEAMMADHQENKEEFISAFLAKMGDWSVKFIDNDTLQLDNEVFIRVR
jgi:hypothetical protein